MARIHQCLPGEPAPGFPADSAPPARSCGAHWPPFLRSPGTHISPDDLRADEPGLTLPGNRLPPASCPREALPEETRDCWSTPPGVCESPADAPGLTLR